MKRSGFKPKLPPRPVRDRSEEFASFVLMKGRMTGLATMARAALAPVTIPKEEPVRHEGYRRLVAAMPCAHCGRHGPCQAAHADQGKGMGLKADDRTCYPACATKPGEPGCHDLIGTLAAFTRDQRREMEARYAASTRASIISAGLWPDNLRHW